MGLTFSSCSSDDDISFTNKPSKTSLSIEQKVLSEKNFSEFIDNVDKNMANNHDFVNQFIRAADNGKLRKEQMLKMLSILNIDKNIDVSRLDILNKENRTYKELNDIELKPLGDDCDDVCLDVMDVCEKLLRIRDAMLDECDNYVWGLDQACKGAVMIAYWYKSDKAGC